MRYSRALLLVDLDADPAPAVGALVRLSDELETVALVVMGEAEAIGKVSAWHGAVADLCRNVDVHQAGELTSDGLLEITRAYAADLLVAGARSVESARLLATTAKRLGIAVLWPSEASLRGRVEHAFCIAIGERSRAAVFDFLRDHADPALQISIVGPPAFSSADLSDALRANGIEATVELIPRSSSVRAALDAAWRGDQVDLIVLARLPALLLVGYSWPAPVLLVPTQEVKLSRRRVLDVPDVVEIDGAILNRIEEVVVGDVMTTASERGLTFAAGSNVVNLTTSPDGEVHLPGAIAGDAPVVVWVADEGRPDVLAAGDQRFRVIHPDPTRWTLFDAELDAKLLPKVPTPGAQPLAVRLRPSRRVVNIRQRLSEAGVEAPVVDARAVLDEGPAYDVAEANDPVRLRRVAARMEKAGYRVALFERVSLGAQRGSHPEVHQGNRVELEFDNSRARHWLLDGIARARRSVSLQVYMAADDDVGQVVEAALTAAGRRGVVVRVLVDSLHGLHGSFGVENSLLSRLAQQPGVDLRVSRPVDGVPSLSDVKRRDHRKLVILDRRVALLGGRNLAHEYYTGFEEVALRSNTTWRMVPWLDAGARVEGPAVREIEDAFISAWVKSGGSGFESEALEAAGKVPLRVIVHRGLRDAHTLEAYLALIAGARSHVYLVNGFPLLLELQHALLDALARGVRVVVLSGHPMPTHDGQPFPGPWATARSTATEVAHSRLDPVVGAGGEVHFYAKRGVEGWDPKLGVVLPHVHAKVLSVDGERCCVGSANFDVTSSYWESELMIEVEDAELVRGLELRIDELLQESISVERGDPEWRARAELRRWMRRWPGMLAP